MLEGGGYMSTAERVEVKLLDLTIGLFRILTPNTAGAFACRWRFTHSAVAARPLSPVMYSRTALVTERSLAISGLTAP